MDRRCAGSVPGQRHTLDDRSVTPAARVRIALERHAAHVLLGTLPTRVFVVRGIAERCRLAGALDPEDVARLRPFAHLGPAQVVAIAIGPIGRERPLAIARILAFDPRRPSAVPQIVAIHGERAVALTGTVSFKPGRRFPQAAFAAGIDVGDVHVGGHEAIVVAIGERLRSRRGGVLMLVRNHPLMLGARTHGVR